MATWNLDKSHSEIEFKVRHMMISTVKGQFNNFDINVESASEDLSEAKISVSIDVDSINTNNEQRDEHLKNADFFNVAENNKITFISTNIVKKSDEDFEVTGDLTIKGVTNSKTFKVELGGVAIDPWGNAKVGYTVTGAINRADFGLTWNAALETGGVMLSDEVKFTADIQLVKG
ncbi:YceI family protein [Sphingobacterium rhinopitheci]|uniref:YceI family protein n=1 Tax=Sphingobacterium rhinopitheci TaxID=2781960 RepID=UPI001F52AF30|nr:YceI family protein [Sphingobacterium rhinopitheci]MCI0919737.1 polyisoprenoid-binding protein [Sphingobacterium rhinopitheci]